MSRRFMCAGIATIGLVAGCTSSKSTPATTTTVATTTTTTSTTTTTTTTPELSSSELAISMNKICKERDVALKPVPDPTTPAKAAEGFPTVLAAFEASHKAMKALKVSSSDAKLIAEYIASSNKANKILADLLKSADIKDQTKIDAAIGKYTLGLVEFGTLATAAGWDACDPTGGSSSTSTSTTPGGDLNVDLSKTLAPVDGYTFEAVPAASLSALSGLFATPEVKAALTSVGSTIMLSKTGVPTVVLVIGLSDLLASAEEQKLFVDGIAASGKDVALLTFGGIAGSGFAMSGGQFGWVAGHNKNVLFTISFSDAERKAATEALLAANPNL